jgi:predicted cation transporter
MLPIPKLAMPSKIDSASDGLGLFFYSRKIYALCAATILFYAVLIWAATIFSFVLAFILGMLSTIIYSVVVRPPT